VLDSSVRDIRLIESSIPKSGVKQTGVLVIAHGDSDDRWNESVRRVLTPLRDRYLLELAFLFPVPGETLQDGLDRLATRGADTVLAIPLLVSSYSEHFEELEYVLGLREKILPVGETKLNRVCTNSQIKLGRAIDSNPLVTQILKHRVCDLSVDPSKEVLVLVGHGPNSEDYNREWLRHIDTIGATIQQDLPFQRVHAFTLRDDAPTEIRDAASRALRLAVEQESSKANVLIATLLISNGEVQTGIKERLKGLTYNIAHEGLASDPLITDWIEMQISELIS